MRRSGWLAAACLIGALVVVAVASGLRAGAGRAAETPPSPRLSVARRSLDPAVVINEVAWMGTEASSSDEWIELYNRSDSPIDIQNWSIYGADTGKCLNFSEADGALTTTILAHSYLIYANHDDDLFDVEGVSLVTIWDATVGLNNVDPGQLILYAAPDCGGTAVDTVNQVSGDWFAGDAGDRRTMERRGPYAAGTDGGNWSTHDPSVARYGHDAEGHLIHGTPKCRNSAASPAADLAVRIEGIPAQAEPGDRLTYAIRLRNGGNVPAAAIWLTNSLPSGVSFAAQTSPYTFRQPAPSTLAWELGDLPIGTAFSAVTVTVDVDAGASGPLTSFVTATTVVTDTPAANNTFRATVTVHDPPRPAELIVSKSGPAVVDAGTTITYQVTVTNAGTGPALSTLLTDTLPPAVEFISQTSPFTFTSLGRNLVWQLGDVPPDATRPITVVGYVTGSVSSPSVLVNAITATTTADETAVQDNSALCTTTVEAGSIVMLPLILRGYTAPLYGVIVEAFLYDGLQTEDYDEAVLLLNGGHRAVDLTGWNLCKRGAEDWTCADLPAVEIGPHERLWLARSSAYLARSFGFSPDHVLVGWPCLANTGDEVMLRDAEGRPRDVVVYKKGLTDVDGWRGPAIQPYRGPNFAEEGQILYRRLDEETGWPAEDTDTAADWAQDAGDPWHGRRVRYPGWDLEPFSHPAVGSSGTVTVGVAPDNAYRLVADAIRSARETIELEAYTLEHHGLVMELVERARQGVSVTILLEGAPVGGLEDQTLWACQQLHATGHGTCAFMINASDLDIYDRYTYLHAKFIVVDRKRLLLGSQNLSHGGLPDDDKSNGTGGSRGVVFLTDAPEMVARAVEVFEADCDPDNHVDISTWSSDNALGYGLPPVGFAPDRGPDWVTYTLQFPDTTTAVGTGFELVTAPEAALRTSDALLGLLARAGRGDGVYVEQLYEHRGWPDLPAGPNPRLQAYVDAARRGARVRILLNGGSFELDYLPLTENVETAAYVNEVAQAEGLDLSAHLGDPTQYGIHNKMVLVDLGGEAAYAHVGSINGSETSNKVNREMALQVRSRDVFEYLYRVFQHDWNHRPPEGHLLISEVMVDPDGVDAGREWVELYNPTVMNVDLSGWSVGDVGPEGEYGSGLYRFPPGATLVAEGVILLAHQAEDVPFTPDYEFLVDTHRDDPSVPNMRPAGAWDGFGLALGNGGDEVLLLDAEGHPVDVVTWGAGSYPGVMPHPGWVGQGHSLERRPPREDTDDCSRDFFDRYPPTPGELPD